MVQVIKLGRCLQNSIFSSSFFSHNCMSFCPQMHYTDTFQKASQWCVPAAAEPGSSLVGCGRQITTQVATRNVQHPPRNTQRLTHNDRQAMHTHTHTHVCAHARTRARAPHRTAPYTHHTQGTHLKHNVNYDILDTANTTL